MVDRLEEHFPMFVKWMSALVVLCILFLILVIVGSVMPYEPYVFYDYTDLPKEVCPGESIEGYIDREVKEGPYIVGRLTGQSYMIRSSDGRPGDSVDIDIDLSPHERDEVPTYALRSAPFESGEWNIGGKYIVNGYMFGFVPTTQGPIFNESTESITVLPITDERCRFS